MIQVTIGLTSCTRFTAWIRRTEHPRLNSIWPLHIHKTEPPWLKLSEHLLQEEHCPFDQIERIVRPDGQLRYVRAVAVPVVEQGVFKGFVGTTIDVTEQELLTQELRTGKSIPRGSAKPHPHRQLGDQFPHRANVSFIG